MDSSEPLEELCQRLKASDRGAFEQVFRRLREGLLRYVRSILCILIRLEKNTVPWAYVPISEGAVLRAM